MKLNVVKVRVVDVKTWQGLDSKYRHELEMHIYVNTARLWDTPRQYLWKHLGSCGDWTLQDGTKISFVRIHQK